MPKLINKLTDKHVMPQLIPKMRVKYAAEVLSKTVSNFIDIILHLNGGKIKYKTKTYNI